MIRLTLHALERIEEQGLEIAWIEAALAKPARRAPDPRREGVTRSWIAVAAVGGRALRVAHRTDGDDVVVITAHWDGKAKL